MDLKESLAAVRDHNHTRTPHLFLDPDELGDRLEVVTSKEGDAVRIDLYVLQCVFLNLKINGQLCSVCTVKDLDGKKRLCFISNEQEVSIRDSIEFESYPLRYQDLKRQNLMPQQTTKLLIVPASPGEMKLFSFLPEGIGVEYDQPAQEDADLYTTIRNFLSDRWGVYKDVFLDLVVCDIIASWVREIFPAAPIETATGKHGTGKTLLIQNFETLGFLAIDLASITGPSIAFIDDLYHPFLLHDECQVLNNSKAPDVGEKVAILNSRYKHRAKRVKMSDATPTRPRGIETQRLYGFSVLAGTEIPQQLGIQDRRIPLPSIYATPKKPIDDQDSERAAALIRCRALAFRARHLFDDFSTYRVEFDKTLEQCTGRLRELAYSILYAAKICTPVDGFNRLVEFFVKLDQSRREETTVGELPDVLSCYLKVLEDPDDKDGEDKPLATILKKLNEDRPEKERMTSQWLGQKMKTLGFKSYRENSARRRTLLRFDKDLLAEQVATFGLNYAGYKNTQQPLGSENENKRNANSDKGAGTCEICGREDATPITRLGESTPRYFCADHLKDYKGNL